MSRNLSKFPFRLFAAIAATSLFVSGFAVGEGQSAHALGLFAGAGIQPLAANGSSFHYYASGKRIDLTPSVNWVSVKFADANPGAQADVLRSPGVPLSATGGTRATPSKDWTLVPVTPGTTQAALVEGINAMRGMPAKFAEVNPVFQAGNDEMAVTDEFIATFDPAESQAQIDAANAMYGVEVVQPLLGQPNTFLLRVSASSHMDALAISNLYQDSGVALTAAPNFVRITHPNNATLSAATAQSITPAAPSFTPPPNDYWYQTPGTQWALNNTLTNLSWASHTEDIDAPEAWGVTTGSSSVIIAVVDSGVEFTHEDLTGKVVTGYDETGGGSAGAPCDVTSGPCGNNDDAQGTAMAGIAAAHTNNSIGIAGVCPDCMIMPVRIETGDGTGNWNTTDAEIVNGIADASSHGASVIVSSLHLSSPSPAVTNAIAAATSSGIVVVFAAGDNNSSSVSYPANLSATNSGVIAVGALNWCDQRKEPMNGQYQHDICNNQENWGSNYGPELDLTAPGIVLAVTDRMGIAGFTRTGPGACVSPGDGGNYYTCYSGTSGAAAIVAGVAGLLRSVRTGLSPADVKTILRSTAVDINTPGFDNDTGYGRVNANNAVRAATNVYIGGTFEGSYYVPSGGRVTPRYPVQNGPVRVVSTAGNVFSSERVHNANGFINELMGFPTSQLTNEYWFPWYDDLGMATWILVSNPSTTDTAHVHISIGPNEMPGSPFTVGPGSVFARRFGLMNGPVHVLSDFNVVTTERVATGQGFVQETMGFPNTQLTNEYWFPWYDNLGMISWILVGNPNTSPVSVTITIGAHAYGPYPIPGGGRIVPQFSEMNGPVHVVSTGGNVFTSERVHNINGFVQETMGVPANRLTNEYWFPWYDNLGMISWILVGNPNTSGVSVTISIGGTPYGPYSIPGGGRITPQFGVMNGPVHVVSTGGNVFTSERVHTGQGFVQETMGYPNGALTTEYWFPWYDNLTTMEWALVGAP